MPRKRHPEPAAAATPAENAPIATHFVASARHAELVPGRSSTEDAFDAALRPRSFDEYIGEHKVVDNLKVFVEAARRRGEALDHVLFCGPPGLGKTTLAHLIAGALGVN